MSHHRLNCQTLENMNALIPSLQGCWQWRKDKEMRKLGIGTGTARTAFSFYNKGKDEFKKAI
ncbi:MAG: hypothetical protein OHK0037_02700 [Elainellaceae cyanobacterium]